MPTPLPDRVVSKEFHQHGSFAVDALTRQESDRITADLEQLAEAECRRQNMPDEEHLRSVCRSRATLLADRFSRCAVNRDPRLLDAARQGVLARHAPSRGAITSLEILTALLGLAEVGIGVAQYALDRHATLAVLLPAAMLAVGGVMLGSGLAGIISKAWSSPLPEHVPQLGPDLSGWQWKLAVGAAVIGFITYWRYASAGRDGFVVVLLTLALALLMAVTHALASAMRSRRNGCLEAAFHAGAIWASDVHADNGEAATHGQGPWVAAFTGRVLALRQLESRSTPKRDGREGRVDGERPRSTMSGALS